jgi:hypothetical protein
MEESSSISPVGRWRTEHGRAGDSNQMLLPIWGSHEDRLLAGTCAADQPLPAGQTRRIGQGDRQRNVLERVDPGARCAALPSKAFLHELMLRGLLSADQPFTDTMWLQSLVPVVCHSRRVVEFSSAGFAHFMHSCGRLDPCVAVRGTETWRSGGRRLDVGRGNLWMRHDASEEGAANPRRRTLSISPSVPTCTFADSSHRQLA